MTTNTRPWLMKRHQRQAYSLESPTHSSRKRAVIGPMSSPSVGSLGKSEQISRSADPDHFPSRQDPPARFAGPSPGWKTKTHKRYTSKDRQLLRTLETTAGSGNAKASECKLTYDVRPSHESSSQWLKRHSTSAVTFPPVLRRC